VRGAHNLDDIEYRLNGRLSCVPSHRGALGAVFTAI
jgi:hypothetical protein